jgi:hypothetical protein
MNLTWQEIIVFCVVFHAVRHVADDIVDKRHTKRIERALRDASLAASKLTDDKIKRVK